MKIAKQQSSCPIQSDTNTADRLAGRSTWKVHISCHFNAPADQGVMPMILTNHLTEMMLVVPRQAVVKLSGNGRKCVIRIDFRFADFS